MKSVLISIQPKWCELIANGKKTVEVRKTVPKITAPFKVYIYCTHSKNGIAYCRGNTILNGKVIGEFVCGGFDEWYYQHIKTLFGNKGGYFLIEDDLNASCLTYEEFANYGNGKPLFGWHISNLVIYDKPRELSEFYTSNNSAIQSCEHREIVGQPEYKTAHNGWIKGSYICNKGEPDWCAKCKTKPITRPPQSWCYVESEVDTE